MKFKKTKVEIRISILEILSVCVHACVCVCVCVCVFVWVCSSFQSKQRAFSAQIYPKMDFGLEIQEINVGIRISILEIPCVPIFRQSGQLWFFWPKFALNGFCGQNFKNKSPDSESEPPRYHVCQFSVKMNNV